MDEEWHVSDSEEEEIEAFPSLSLIDHSLSSNKQRHLFSLYEQIANEGFIPLKFPSLRRVSIEEARKEPTPSKAVEKNSQNPQDSKETKEKSKKNESTVGFDFEDELFDASVVLPRKIPKPAVKKSKKRVGSLENVINDLNRFQRMSAQVMETEKE